MLVSFQKAESPMALTWKQPRRTIGIQQIKINLYATVSSEEFFPIAVLIFPFFLKGAVKLLEPSP